MPEAKDGGWKKQPMPEARRGGKRSYPASEVGAAAGRRYLTPPKLETRGDSREELPHAPTSEARGGGREEQLRPEAKGGDERSYSEPWLPRAQKGLE